MVDSANKKLKSAPLDAFAIAGNALAKSKKEGDRRGEAEANKTLGTLYYNNSEYNKAIPYFLQADKLFEVLKDDKNREYVLDYLGKCYEALGELDKSIGYFSKAEDLADSDSSRFEFAFSNSRVQNKAGDKELAKKSLEYELDNNSALDPRQKANA
ncbi:hypothetical protein GYB22_03280 [bacterium]|nr:hypothetical protein [bacterium]